MDYLGKPLISILTILSSQEAQEGSWRGCDQEEDSSCPEVPACRRWSNFAGKRHLYFCHVLFPQVKSGLHISNFAFLNNLWSGHHGEEKPEARSAKSPEGAGSPRRQGSEESHRQEACCQGEIVKSEYPCFSPMFTLYYIQDKAAQKAQKATKNVQKAGPGRVGGKR